MAGSARPLLERDAQQWALERLMASAAAGEGGLAILEGPAGIGKTRLLRFAVDAAPAHGLRALAGRASDLERDLPFGIARQLLEAPLRDAGEAGRARLLGGSARRAATVLELQAGVGGDTEPSAAAHALYWLVSALADERPLLLAVDDLHWSDDPSLRFLAHLTRRLEGLPVAVVGTLRAGEPVAGALAAMLAEPATTVLRPEPLGTASVARLLAERFGEPAAPAFAEACRARTGGNPFLLSELSAELASRGVRPTAAEARAVDAVVPERVGLAVGRRFAALGEDEQALARAVVVLGDGVEPGLAAALGELDPHAATAAAARLAGADLLDAGPLLGFRHPLVRAAVAETVGDAARGRAHARAARLLAERGASPARVAAHLVASPPGGGDPWAVGALRGAARAVRRQGAPEQAVAPLRRALAEPAPPDIRPALLRELGRAELAGMEAPAAEHLELALELLRDPSERAAVALELGMAHYTAGDHRAAVRVLLRAIGELGPDQREDRLRLEAFLAVAGRYDMRTEAEVRGRVHALARELRGDSPGERLVLAVAALERPGPTAEGLAEAAALQERVVGETPWPDPSEGVGTVAMYLHAGRPDRARILADAIVERARRADSPARHALGLLARGAVQLDVGRLDEAEADMRDALAEAGILSPGSLAPGVGQLVLVLAERGGLTDAQALLAEHALDGDVPEQMRLNPLLHARAVLRLAQGRWDDAAADARELGRRHERWGLRRPSPDWRAIAAEALRAVGDLAAAGELAAASLELARAWGTPKAVATALRAHALVSAPATARAELEEALAGLAGTPWSLETARVQVELGAVLRRSGARRSAREHLAEGMDRAHRCGAGGLAARAAEELRATGARPRRHAQTGRDALTPGERRVATLAVAGRSNREIAQALFITVATVETHLRRVYRKLGADGRAGLAEAMSRDDAGTCP